MTATLALGHDVQNWDDPEFAIRMRNRIGYLFEDSDIKFSTLLSIDANARTWDSLRKYLVGQPRVRIANPRRGESPKFYVLLKEPPPQNMGKLVYSTKTLATKEDVFDVLWTHLVVDEESDAAVDGPTFRKYRTNVKELRVLQNTKRSDGKSSSKLKPGVPKAWEEYAIKRGAILTTLSDDKGKLTAIYPEGHDQTEFRFYPAVPSGNEEFTDDDETESEVDDD